MRLLKSKRIFGLTLIELMIVVAIVGILAAVAIPVYQSYIRRSYLSEATSSIAAIKSAEESYFTINGCYVEALPNPAAVPSGGTTLWDAGVDGWGRNALAVRPDRSVRFQYRVIATNAVGCEAPTMPASDLEDTDLMPVACVATPRIGAPGSLIDTAFHPDNWYVVVVQGDLDTDGTLSTIVSAIDNSVIFMCNELE